MKTTLGLMRRMDLTELFQASSPRATRFSFSRRGWIAIYDPLRDDFEFKAAIGRLPPGSGRASDRHWIIGELWRTNRTVLVDDYHVWPQRSWSTDFDVRRATVGIPLRSEADALPGLSACRIMTPRRFEDDETDDLERFAALASIALDNAWSPIR